MSSVMSGVECIFLIIVAVLRPKMCIAFLLLIAAYHYGVLK